MPGQMNPAVKGIRPAAHGLRRQVPTRLGARRRGTGRRRASAEMREALAAITATGAAVGLQDYLCVLAQACGECGEASEGLDLLERALSIAEAGAKYRLPELLRTKGELLLRQNPRDDTAESWFQRAVTMARDEGTKSLELRAASASRGCIATAGATERLATCSRLSTPGSPKVSIRAISSKPRNCSTNLDRCNHLLRSYRAPLRIPSSDLATLRLRLEKSHDGAEQTFRFSTMR